MPSKPAATPGVHEKQTRSVCLLAIGQTLKSIHPDHPPLPFRCSRRRRRRRHRRRRFTCCFQNRVAIFRPTVSLQVLLELLNQAVPRSGARAVPRLETSRGPLGRQPRRCDPPPPYAPSRPRRRCRTNPLLAMHSFGCQASAARVRVLWPMSRCGPEADPWTRSWRCGAALRLDSRNRLAPSNLSAPGPRRLSMPSPRA